MASMKHFEDNSRFWADENPWMAALVLPILAMHMAWPVVVALAFVQVAMSVHVLFNVLMLLVEAMMLAINIVWCAARSSTALQTRF